MEAWLSNIHWGWYAVFAVVLVFGIAWYQNRKQSPSAPTPVPPKPSDEQETVRFPRK